MKEDFKDAETGMSHSWVRQSVGERARDPIGRVGEEEMSKFMDVRLVSQSF